MKKIVYQQVSIVLSKCQSTFEFNLLKMDTTGPAKTPLQISAQRRFFQWAVKWFYTQLKEDVSTPISKLELCFSEK